MIPLKERSARRRELYLITHNTQKRQTFMTPAEFESAMPASELPLTQTLDRTATGISKYSVLKIKQGTRMLCKISYKEKLLKYIERFKTHHDRLRMNKYCKISTKYIIKNIFIKHPTYFSILPFVLKSLVMLDWRTI
jgi:hypothetical protein